MPTAIPLTEEFNDSRGKIWQGYDAYQPADRTNMAKLKHVDIRTFEQNDATSTRTVLQLSTFTVGQLSAQTVAGLASLGSVGGGERWTSAECERVVGNNYVSSINILADSTGVASATSVIPKKYTDLAAVNYTNLCPEPNFEAAITGWTQTVASNNHLSTSGATLSRSQAVMPHSGSRSGVLAGFSGATIGSGTALSIPGTFKSGVSYTASIWIRRNTSSASHLSFYFGEGAADRIVSSFGSIGTTWIRKQITWVPTADRSSVFIAVRAESTAASGSTYYIDDILVTATDTAGQPAYFDGNSSGYIWLGTPNLSTSSGPYTIVPDTIDLCQNVGQTLSCSTGVWTGNPVEFSYQWYRNGVAIPLATDSSYTLTVDDQQAIQGVVSLRCIVTATDGIDPPSGPVLSATASSDGVTTTGSGYTIVTYPVISGWPDFYNDDHIVLSSPSYTAGTTAASSYLDLTSNPSGDFAVGPTASVAFSASITTPTNGAASELRFLRSQFNQNGIDLSKVTGVRIRITSSNGTPTNHTFVGGVRLLSKDWQYSALDIDTRYGRLRKTVPRDANASTVPTFTWPILWRSNTPSGQNDPRPIDAEFGVEFYTGTIVNSNTVALYFREVTADFMTQLDINGLKQSSFNGFNQPDIGTAMYNLRTMTDLDVFNQDTLEDESQLSLERTPKYLSASWTQALFQWGSGGAGTITFINSEGGGYNLPLVTTLTNNTRYVFYVRCEENSMRASIYSLDSSRQVVSKIFDSDVVEDSFFYKRRAGRFGWFADLRDGSAWVDAIRERYANFGEYRSLPLRSITPVDGAELFIGASPNIEKVTGVEAGQFNSTGTTIAPDSAHSVSGESHKITSSNNSSFQGLQTNVFSITDWTNARAEFDIFYPSYASGTQPIGVFLFDKNNLRGIELVHPNIIPNQWQHIVIDFPYETLLTGDYRLSILQANTSAQPWWVDNISVFSRSVVWDGRAVVDDPWKANDARWTPFREIHNQENGGVLFPKRGTDLQIRGKALRQFAEINRIQFKPKYSQLGAIPVPDPTDPAAYGFGTGKPTSGVVTGTYSVTTPAGSPVLTRRFTGSGTSTFGAGAYIAQYVWSFGDGSVGYGQVVDHTFPVADTYTIVLTVIDNFGYQATYTQSVGVS